MRARATLAVAAAVAALAVAGCTSGPAQPAGGRSGTASDAPAVPSQPSALHWRHCQSALLCSSIKVPLNYAKPGGRKISLALSEAPATAPASKQLGILLVNPGGPGGSGTG